MRRIRPLGSLAMGSVARRMGEQRPAPGSEKGTDIATALRGVMEQLEAGISKITTAPQPELNGASGALGTRRSQIVFGYTVRVGEGGLSAEPFGDMPQAEPAADKQRGAAARQPIVDIFEEADGYLVIAELPGVQLQDVSCKLLDNTLHIDTAGPRPYAKQVILPGPANPENLRVSCQHGILEVRLQHARDPA